LIDRKWLESDRFRPKNRGDEADQPAIYRVFLYIHHAYLPLLARNPAS
jgi:hypothetical protein